MAEVIPQSALAFLPLKAESIKRWKESSDLARFMEALFGPSYPSHGTDRFWEHLEEIKKLAEDFSIASLDVHHQDQKKIVKKKNEFLGDLKFGKAAKSIIAWKGIDEAMLSDGVFVSIQHTLEATSDLDCSISLVKLHYYKQAGYCLRAFIENITLPLLFSQDPTAYDSWKTAGYRVPRFRGKDGLLAKLVQSGVLTNTLSARTSTLYDSLNAFVHSSVTCMIHSGHETGNWRGLSFKLDEFYN